MPALYALFDMSNDTDIIYSLSVDLHLEQSFVLAPGAVADDRKEGDYFDPQHSDSFQNLSKAFSVAQNPPLHARMARSHGFLAQDLARAWGRKGDTKPTQFALIHRVVGADPSAMANGERSGGRLAFNHREGKQDGLRQRLFEGRQQFVCFLGSCSESRYVHSYTSTGCLRVLGKTFC